MGYTIFSNIGNGGRTIGRSSGNGAVYEKGKLIGKAGSQKNKCWPTGSGTITKRGHLLWEQIERCRFQKR